MAKENVASNMLAFEIQASDLDVVQGGSVTKRKHRPMLQYGIAVCIVVIVIAVAVVLLLAAKGKAVPAVRVLRVFNVSSAGLDPRSYRGLILANGLRVLLASYPEAGMGAASLEVQVGYMSDPASLPGLANLCGHMLYFASKKFPKESEFDRMVSSGGGYSNAITYTETSNYYFNVRSEVLQLTLEHFASYLIAPLFEEKATSREVNAVNHEFNNYLQRDDRRYLQLLKLRADQSHPYAKFGTGNAETLRNGSSTTRASLFDFHGRYFQADRMALALVGPQPLETLQELAVSNFAEVPSSDPPLPPASDAYDRLPIPFRPSHTPAEATLMVPIKDIRILSFVWCVPITNLEHFTKTQPHMVWLKLLQNHGKGGLLPLLKKKGFALHLDSFIEDSTASWILLALDISLTPLGETKWFDVASLVFAYIRMLRESGVPLTLVSEIKSMSKIYFTYAEPAEPLTWATSASNNLFWYPPEQWVTGEHLIADGGEAGAEYMLKQCADPANALITLLSKRTEANATDTEPIFGTRYSKLPLDREVNTWRNAKIPHELAPPEPNPFIPTDFSLKCASGKKTCIAAKRDGTVVPLVLDDVPGLRLHFLQDSTFQRPKGHAFFLFRSPLLYASPKASAISELFESVFVDVLQDATYQAGLAGLGAIFGAGRDGISLSAYGYNARLPEFVAYISQQVRSVELPALVFDRQRELLQRQYANAKLRSPVSLCSYYRGLATRTPSHTAEEIATAVKNTTLADVVAFQKSLLPESLLEAFLVGNFAESEARGLVESVTKAIPSSAPMDSDKIPRWQIVRLQPGKRYLQQFVANNSEEEDSAIEVFLQIGLVEGDDRFPLALLSKLIEQPFYDALRVKQQLGYIVSSFYTEHEGVRAFVLQVQSSKLQPPQVEERINSFLKDYRSVLAGLNETELGTYRESLAVLYSDVDKKLSQQAGRLWSEIVQRRYDYDRPWRAAEQVRKVTPEQLLAFYDRFLMPGAPEERRLVTHVFAPKKAPSETVKDILPGEFYPAPLERPLPTAAVNKALNL